MRCVAVAKGAAAHAGGEVLHDVAREHLLRAAHDVVEGGLVAEHDAEQLAVLLREAEEGFGAGVRTLERFLVAGTRGVELRFEAANAVFDEGDEDRFLGRIVQVERPDADARMAGDVDDLGSVIALGGQDIARRFEKIAGGLFALALKAARALELRLPETS